MTGEKGTLPLIRTKPYRPRISGDLVPRLRLLERLERWRDRALPFVVAPAGDGKTTLVTGGRAAWNWPNCSAICPERFTRLVIANAQGSLIYLLPPGARRVLKMRKEIDHERRSTSLD